MKNILLGIQLILFSVIAQAENYQLAQGVAEPFHYSITRTGKLAFRDTVQLSFKKGGYLTNIQVNAGDLFKKGDVLATLDTAELVEDKNAKYAQLLQAKRDVARLKKLIKQEVSAKQALEKAQTQLSTARSVYKVAYYNLEKAQLVAPFNGIVLARLTQKGELQVPGKPAISIASITQKNWVVKVALTESDITKLSLQQAVNVQINQQPNLTGFITQIPAIADPNSGLFIVEISLQNFEYKPGIIAGQIAQVTFDLSNPQYVYKVPLSALVGINSSGQAILMTETTSQKIQKKTFEILQLGNEFVYLFTKTDNSPIQYVSQGWQHILAKGQ